MGQDPRRMPYSESGRKTQPRAQTNTHSLLSTEPSTSITCQIGSSLTSSLKNLRHEESGSKSGSSSPQPYIDCLILHSPFPDMKDTQEAWRAMELHVPTSARTLGLSNVYALDALRKIYDFAATKPTVLQNRFYPVTAWDREVRAFCAEKGIVYQSFWTLTANPELLRSEVVAEVKGKVGVSAEVALYALVLGLGRVSVLDGTTSEGRMKGDLEGVEKVREWREREGKTWEEVMGRFREVVG